MPPDGAERRPTHEIRLAGRLGPALQLAFQGLRADMEPRHSVLITQARGEALPALIERLRRRDVDVTAARQRTARTRHLAAPGSGLPGRGEPSAGTARHHRGADTKEAVTVPDRQWEIHVSGVVPESVLAEWDGLEATVEPATTVLYGCLSDEAALYGVLDRVQSLGLRLVEVRRLPEVERRPEPVTRPTAGEAADPVLGHAERDEMEVRR